MYIKRTAYQRLLHWKNESGHSTLEVRGARQTGKTFLINKFTNENFNHKIYINFSELSGEQFLRCYESATSWIPGTPRPLHPLKEAFTLFNPDFEDTRDTVIILDEIQESAEIYNRIREFTRQFNCYFIVICSYPGKLLEPEFHFSCGDLTSMTLYTLSFEEFLLAADEELFRLHLLVGNSVSEDKAFSGQVRSLYDVYCQIGGYPSVVETYLTTGSLEAGMEELTRIIGTFLNESVRYFTDIPDAKVFTDTFSNIGRILTTEKREAGQTSIGYELQNLITADKTCTLSPSMVIHAINWLYHSGMIGYCGEVTGLDILDFKPGRRCYFMDLGIANYYMTQAGLDKITINTAIRKNYVYINLAKRLDSLKEIAFEMPIFATYANGEIDFYVQSLDKQIRYAIEVKSACQIGAAAKEALNDKKVDYILCLEYNTHGEEEGNVIVRPIYSLERLHF